MYSVNQLVRLIALSALLLVASCGGDLNPSGADMRPVVVAGSTGTEPTQISPDFTLQNSYGANVTLSDYFTGGANPVDAVVLYFTMWCPICMSHSDHMLYTIMPKYAGRVGKAAYVLVDYVSGSVAGTRASEIVNGYNGSPFVVLADSSQSVFNMYNAAMGTVIVMDKNGQIIIKEDYRSGAKLDSTLGALIP